MKPITERTLKLTEHAALLFVAAHPSCTNRRLAEELRLTERGVEALVKRLRDAGHLRAHGAGCARRFEVSFPAECHMECGISAAQSDHTKCEVPPTAPKPAAPHVQPGRIAPLDVALEQTIHAVSQIVRERDCPPEVPYRLLQTLITRIETELPDCPERQVVLDDLVPRRDGLLAVSYCVRNLPKKYLPQASGLLHRATPAQLAQLRQRIEADKLPGASAPRLLLECLASSNLRTPGPQTPITTASVKGKQS